MAPKDTNGDAEHQEPGPHLGRRRFLKRAGLASALLAVNGCAGDDGSPPATGTLRVRITGLAGTAVGSITVTDPVSGLVGSLSIPLPAPVGGVAEFQRDDVPVGSYRLTYATPTNHVLVSASNVQDVTVTADSNQTVEFATRGIGRVEVTVGGLAGASGSGTIAVRTATGEATTITLALSAPAGGTAQGANASHPVGSYRIVYAPPTGFSVVGATSQDVTVALGGTVAVAFTAQAIPAGPEVVFTSNWSTATGTTVNAIRDGGKWDSYNENANMAVVAATALGFPTPNALRIDYEGGVARGVRSIRQWTIPAVGGYLARRIIFRNDHVGSSYPATFHHPVMSTDGTPCCNFASEWFFHRITGVENQYEFEIATLSDGTQPPLYRWRLNTRLSVGTVYQVEERYQRIGNDTWNLDVRMWNGAGTTQLFSSSNFFDNFNSTGLLSRTPKPSILMPATCSAAPCLESLIIIDQGVIFPANSFIYYGGVAVCKSTDGQWCGPIVAA